MSFYFPSSQAGDCLHKGSFKLYIRTTMAAFAIDRCPSYSLGPLFLTQSIRYAFQKSFDRRGTLPVCRVTSLVHKPSINALTFLSCHPIKQLFTPLKSRCQTLRVFLARSFSSASRLTVRRLSEQQMTDWVIAAVGKTPGCDSNSGAAACCMLLEDRATVCQNKGYSDSTC